jgi:hypothetical protein
VAIVMKLAYKPVGLITGVLGGLIAIALFNELWGPSRPATRRPMPPTRAPVASGLNRRRRSGRSADNQCPDAKSAGMLIV